MLSYYALAVDQLDSQSQLYDVQDIKRIVWMQ